MQPARLGPVALVYEDEEVSLGPKTIREAGFEVLQVAGGCFLAVIIARVCLLAELLDQGAHELALRVSELRHEVGTVSGTVDLLLHALED